MIAPGIVAAFVTGIATAVVGGISLLGPIDGGPLWVFVPLFTMLVVVVTTPMTLAHDRKWELEDAARRGLVGLIIVLMVLKPF
jgi:hypothetical protein